MPATRPLDYAGPRRDLANRRSSRLGAAFFFTMAGMAGILAVLGLIGIAAYPLVRSPDAGAGEFVAVTASGVVWLGMALGLCYFAYQAARDRLDR